ncbi:MAG: NERD domain-containing protein [Actinomycetota bacterium]|nr:NERD domain-containing protein [Actinomycetota bacterium]
MAGRSASREALRRRRRTTLRRLLVLIGGAIALGSVPAGFRLAVLIATVVVAAWPSKAGRWGAGAAGERATAAALAGAEREGWTIFHDVRLPGRRWNLDHVLIGPPGVIVVETKQWRDPVRTWRQHPRILEERVGWQIDAVAAALGMGEVAGFLCVHGATVRRFRRGTAVGDGRHLRRWLRRRTQVLSDRAVRDLALHAQRTFE